MEQELVLVNSGADYVLIRWLRELGVAASRAFAAELDLIAGVEQVVMRRYSARLLVATHVAECATVAQDVLEAFHDPEVQAMLRLQHPDVRFSIVYDGPVVRLA